MKHSTEKLVFAFKKAPENVKRGLINSEFSDVLEEIIKKYNLTENQSIMLAEEVLFMILNLSTIETFKTTLIEKLNLSSDLATKLATEIFSTVIIPIQQNYNPEEKRKFNQIFNNLEHLVSNYPEFSEKKDIAKDFENLISHTSLKQIVLLPEKIISNPNVCQFLTNHQISEIYKQKLFSITSDNKITDNINKFGKPETKRWLKYNPIKNIRNNII